MDTDSSSGSPSACLESESIDAEQQRDEEHFRQAERAMLYADDATQKIATIARELQKDDAPPHLVAALAAASEAIQNVHRELVKAAYWKAPR